LQAAELAGGRATGEISEGLRPRRGLRTPLRAPSPSFRGRDFGRDRLGAGTAGVAWHPRRTSYLSSKIRPNSDVDPYSVRAASCRTTNPGTGSVAPAKADRTTSLKSDPALHASCWAATFVRDRGRSGGVQPRALAGAAASTGGAWLHGAPPMTFPASRQRERLPPDASSGARRTRRVTRNSPMARSHPQRALRQSTTERAARGSLPGRASGRCWAGWGNGPRVKTGRRTKLGRGRTGRGSSCRARRRATGKDERSRSSAFVRAVGEQGLRRRVRSVIPNNGGQGRGRAALRAFAAAPATTAGRAEPARKLAGAWI